MSKVAGVPISDSVYNRLVNFLTGRSHFTKFQFKSSSSAPISAGVVQGSAIGPAAFIICASDLHPLTPGNQQRKYADDIYLIVPSVNSHSIPSELNHISSWASDNNLRLNPSKCSEIIFKKPRSRTPDPPPSCGIERVSSLKILGVTFQSNLSMTEHTNNLMAKAGQSLYALKILKSSVLADRPLASVCNATLLNSITYASPAWCGFASSEDKIRLQSILNKAFHWGLCSPPSPIIFSSLCDRTDSRLSQKMCIIQDHVLSAILPPKRQSHYELRPHAHDFTLPLNTPFLQQNVLH